MSFWERSLKKKLHNNPKKAKQVATVPGSLSANIDKN